MKEARDNVSANEINAISETICAHAKSLLENITGPSEDKIRLLFYHPLGKEISLNGLFEDVDAMRDRVDTYYPRVHGDTMDFYRVLSLDDLHEGNFHVMEPLEDEKNLFIPGTEDIIICFVPGLCFSRDGGRCGYGKGYYDKYLSSCLKAVKIGICADFQLVDELDTDEYDIKMNYIITEKETIKL